jgi:hypothetical protein
VLGKGKPILAFRTELAEPEHRQKAIELTWHEAALMVGRIQRSLPDCHLIPRRLDQPHVCGLAGPSLLDCSVDDWIQPGGNVIGQLGFLGRVLSLDLCRAHPGRGGDDATFGKIPPS